MTGARIRLVLAVAVYLGWLGWLGAAVYHAAYRPDRPAVLSRAQLTAASWSRASR